VAGQLSSRELKKIGAILDDPLSLPALDRRDLGVLHDVMSKTTVEQRRRWSLQNWAVGENCRKDEVRQFSLHHSGSLN
jgi:hypothetical protein